MKRRKDVPAIPPFIDQWGRPTYDNPFGQYRRNPALDATASPAPAVPPRSVAPITEADVQIQGWESHERHLVPAEPLPPIEPAVPGPVTAEAILERLRRAQSLGVVDAPIKIDRPLPPPLPSAPVAPAPTYVPTPPRVEVPAPPPPAPRVEVTPPPPPAQPPEPLELAVAPPEVAPASVAQTRAERLAEQLAERRVRNRRRARRAGSVAAAGAAVFGVTAAYGFWTGGADAGSRVPRVTVLPVTAEATAGMVSSPLLPRGRGNVKLRVDNPNPFAVTVTGVSGGPFPSAVDGKSGCTIANSGATFIPPHALNVSIPSKTSASIRLPDAAQMGPGSSPECRGHTFTIPVSVTVSTHKG